jgi:lysozyme
MPECGTGGALYRCMRHIVAVSSAGLFVLASGLFGCEGARSGGPVGNTQQGLSTSCGAPANGPVQGVDVSHYQGNFNWQRGVAFGYASTGDGAGYSDPLFGSNWANMQAAGVLRGAYQFFEPGEDPTAQANMMVAAVGQLGPGDLPCMIDVEITGGQSGATIAANVRTWINVVRAGTGLTPIIYTGPYFWDDNVGDTSFGDIPLWIADYGPSCPAVPNGWSTWTLWQYGDSGGSLDTDVFNGSLGDLQALSGGGGGCTPTQTADAADFGCACVGGAASGGYCAGSGCSTTETTDAADFGCACVDHEVSGGYCTGSGCTALETNDAAAFGCACVDHQASGGYCSGTGCTALETNDAAAFGCACVDHQANGGYCPGSGCTVLETEDAAKFGCACVDHQGNGGYCPGSGCTVLETENAAKFGCQCVDHQGAGGFCPGSGCTELETANAAKFGCGCVDHKGAGGACPGDGCTANEDGQCKAAGKTCSMHQCS